MAEGEGPNASVWQRVGPDAPLWRAPFLCLTYLPAQAQQAVGPAVRAHRSVVGWMSGGGQLHGLSVWV